MKIPSYIYNTKYSGIYCIENSINNKRYIGSTKSLYTRLHKHNSLLNHKKHENSYLQNAWNKYGNDKFECYVIEFCKEEELTEREQFWIDELLPEYNITYKVEKNILSDKSRKLISNTLKDGYKSGRIKSRSKKKVKVYDLEGNYLETCESLRKCAEKYNTHVGSILRVLKGIYQQANNLQFRYIDDDKPVNKVDRSRYLRRFSKPAPL